MVKHAGVEYALERAHEYAQSAKDALRPFPSSEDKETLVWSRISSSIATGDPRSPSPSGERAG